MAKAEGSARQVADMNPCGPEEARYMAFRFVRAYTDAAACHDYGSMGRLVEAAFETPGSLTDALDRYEAGLSV